MGRLKQYVQHLDHLVQLGITAIYFTPFFDLIPAASNLY
ncbi:alpha-amylase family glycosyl hydrolase [Paenibacillus germinis]